MKPAFGGHAPRVLRTRHQLDTSSTPARTDRRRGHAAKAKRNTVFEGEGAKGRRPPTTEHPTGSLGEPVRRFFFKSRAVPHPKKKKAPTAV